MFPDAKLFCGRSYMACCSTKGLIRPVRVASMARVKHNWPQLGHTVKEVGVHPELLQRTPAPPRPARVCGCRFMSTGARVTGAVRVGVTSTAHTMSCVPAYLADTMLVLLAPALHQSTLGIDTTHSRAMQPGKIKRTHALLWMCNRARANERKLWGNGCV